MLHKHCLSKEKLMQTNSFIIKRITAAVCSVIIGLTGMQFSKPDSDSITANAEQSSENHITIMGASLTLTGEIGVNFYLDVQDINVFDTVILNGPNGRNIIYRSTLTPETSGLYKLTYLIDPTQIDDTVSICLKKGEESVQLYDTSGTAYNTDVLFSVREYIENVQNDDSRRSDLSVLVNALDVYGKYSDVQFANADDPKLDNVLADVTAADLEKYKFSISGELPNGVSVIGATLIIESKTGFRIYFDKDPGAAAIDGNNTEVIQKDGMYYIEVPDIAAAELDKTHQAVIGDCTMSFSALSYVYSAVENSYESPENVIKLAKALFAYSFAANMYFESSEGDSPTLSETDFILNYDGSDDYADNYSFEYGEQTFTAHYTPYLGGDWKVVDSYRITNRADMIIICEQLLRENKVQGRITQYRTAKDMADEWEIHNKGYTLAAALGMTSAVSRLKDVDMDKKDQGKSFDDFVAEFLGR